MTKTLLHILDRKRKLEHVLRELYQVGANEGQVWIVHHCSDAGTISRWEDLRDFLTQLGASETDARQYAKQMRLNDILVAIQTCDNIALEAEKILNPAQV